MKPYKPLLFFLLLIGVLLYTGCDDEPAPTPLIAIDTDGDGVLDEIDNCLNIANPDQLDANNDGIGDLCDATLEPLFRCVNGMAGPYPCDAIDIMSIIDVATLGGSNASNIEGSDIWGWTDPTTNDEYAIIALTNSTAFVNITDPVNPLFLGRLNSSAGTNF
jgi:hypothetical protein